MKEKSDTCLKFKKFIVEGEAGKKIRYFHIDKGEGYNSSEFSQCTGMSNMPLVYMCQYAIAE